MTIDGIQEGWRFYSADFSREDGPGGVLLKRDPKGTARWHEICSAEPDEDKHPLLYVTGRGRTLPDAIADANKNARAATTILF